MHIFTKLFTQHENLNNLEMTIKRHLLNKLYPSPSSNIHGQYSASKSFKFTTRSICIILARLVKIGQVITKIPGSATKTLTMSAIF